MGLLSPSLPPNLKIRFNKMQILQRLVGILPVLESFWNFSYLPNLRDNAFYQSLGLITPSLPPNLKIWFNKFIPDPSQVSVRNFVIDLFSSSWTVQKKTYFFHPILSPFGGPKRNMNLIYSRAKIWSIHLTGTQNTILNVL